MAALDLVFFALLRKDRGKPLRTASRSKYNQVHSATVMEKKRRKSQELLRKHHYRLRLNDDEKNRFLTNLKRAPGMHHADFIRMMMMEGYVNPPRSKQDILETLNVIEQLQEYKSHFSRIANYMRYSHPEIEKECREIAGIFKESIRKLT